MARKKKNVGSYTYDTIPALFTAICDAIRVKDGTSALINHQDIPAKIGSIPVGATVERATYNAGRVNIWSAMPQYVSTGGKLYIVITAIRDTAYPVAPYKNGTEISRTQGFTNSGRTIGYYEVDTVADDIITFNTVPVNQDLGYDNMLCVIIK